MPQLLFLVLEFFYEIICKIQHESFNWKKQTLDKQSSPISFAEKLVLKFAYFYEIKENYKWSCL